MWTELEHVADKAAGMIKVLDAQSTSGNPEEQAHTIGLPTHEIALGCIVLLLRARELVAWRSAECSVGCIAVGLFQVGTLL